MHLLASVTSRSVRLRLSNPCGSRFRHWPRWVQTQRQTGSLPYTASSPWGRPPHSTLLLRTSYSANTTRLALCTTLFQSLPFTYKGKCQLLSMAKQPLCDAARLGWGSLCSLGSHGSSTHLLQVPDNLWLLEQSSVILHFLLHCSVYVLNFYTSFKLVFQWNILSVSVSNSVPCANVGSAHRVVIPLAALRYSYNVCLPVCSTSPWISRSQGMWITQFLFFQHLLLYPWFSIHWMT